MKTTTDNKMLFFITCDPGRTPSVRAPADWRNALSEFLAKHAELPWEDGDVVYVLRRHTIEDGLMLPDNTLVTIQEWMTAVVQVRRSGRWHLLGTGPVEDAEVESAAIEKLNETPQREGLE